MQHIANTARGRLAKNQQELLKIAMGSSQFKEENMDHLLCEFGFSVIDTDGGGEVIRRMDDIVFKTCLMTLMKSRPSAQLWDITPLAEYKEEGLLVESTEAFRMTFEQKAMFLQDEFMRRPAMAGFRIEYHNIGTKKGGFDNPPSVSFYVYETVEDFSDSYVPVDIKVRYRANF